MAPHNNVKIYNAFFRKNYVLFAFILKSTMILLSRDDTIRREQL